MEGRVWLGYRVGSVLSGEDSKTSLISRSKDLIRLDKIWLGKISWTLAYYHSAEKNGSEEAYVRGLTLLANMVYRFLGRTGMKVSVIGYGFTSFISGTDEAADVERCVKTLEMYSSPSLLLAAKRMA